MNGQPINGRSLAEILSEMRDELQDFVQTRVELLKREVQERVAAVKSAVPLAMVAGLLLTTAFLLLSMALVGVFAGISPVIPTIGSLHFSLSDSSGR